MRQDVGVVLVLEDQELNNSRGFVLDGEVKERFADGLEVDVNFHAYVLLLFRFVHLVDFNELDWLIVLDKLDKGEMVSHKLNFK